MERNEGDPAGRIAHEPRSRFPISVMLHAVRAHLDMDVVFLTRFRDAVEVFLVGEGETEQFGPVKEGAALPLAETYCNEVLRCSEMRVALQARTAEWTRDLEVTRTAGIGAYVGVPVRLADGTVYGTLCCLSRTARDVLSEAQLGFVKTLADLAGAWLDEARVSEQELRARHVIGRAQASRGTGAERAENMLAGLSEIYGWRAAWLSKPAMPEVVLAAWSSLPELPYGEIGPQAGHATAQEAWSSGRTVARSLEATAAEGALHRAGVTSSLCLPIPVEDHARSVLEAFVAEPADALERELRQGLDVSLSRLAAELGAALAPDGQRPLITTREREILASISAGLPVEAIARERGLSIHTVRNHLRHAYEKLGVQTQAAAVAKALRDGWIQ